MGDEGTFNSRNSSVCNCPARDRRLTISLGMEDKIGTYKQPRVVPAVIQG
jgi:hypothetical protein